jgi:hypothetical protein
MTSGKSLQKVFVLLLLNAGFLAHQPVMAEEGEHKSAEVHHDDYLNMIGIFTGIANESRRENGLAVGLEYARYLSNSFAIGALIERTFGDYEVTVAAIPFIWQTEPWKIYVAPGIERNNGDNEKLIRFGVEYVFEFGRYEIAPQVDYDVVEGENAVVVGVLLGMKF